MITNIITFIYAVMVLQMQSIPEQILQFFPLGYFGFFIFLAFVGFFRFAVTNIKPDFILDQKKIQDDWLARSSFTSIFLPIMAFFIFLFNAFAWAVYGLISIVEFIAFIFKAIWWLISWIWNEVIHPVLFFIVKLVWHYLIIWSWRFFKIALTRVPEAFTISTFINGFISVLAISFIVLFFFYLSSLLQQQWLLIVMIIPFLLSVVFFSGYTLYDDSKRSFSSFWSGLMTAKHGFMISTSILSAALIIVLHMFSGTAIQLPLLGISFPVSQILFIILIVALISTLIANTILPAYLNSRSGNFDTKDFLINMGIRLPRLVGAIPFILFGGLIASIVTMIIGGFLWWSTNSIKQTFSENAIDRLKTELNEAGANFRQVVDTTKRVNHALNYSEKNIKRIATLESRIFTLDLISKNWSSVMFNLSAGFRKTAAEKDYINILDESFKAEHERVQNELNELELRLAQIRIEFNAEPDNIMLADRIERGDARALALKRQLGQLEVRKVLNIKLAEARIGSIKYSNVMWVIGTFFALFGLVLIAAIVFTPFWIYRTKVYFDLYDYHHDGKSYLTQEIEFYQERNKNQPLLGFFVVIVVAITLVILL